MAGSDARVCEQEAEKGTQAYKNCILWIAIAEDDTKTCNLLEGDDVEECGNLVKEYSKKP